MAPSVIDSIRGLRSTVAAWLGKTRLTDNVPVNPAG
jgi:pantothenate synthetase